MPGRIWQECPPILGQQIYKLPPPPFVEGMDDRICWFLGREVRFPLSADVGDIG